MTTAVAAVLASLAAVSCAQTAGPAAPTRVPSETTSADPPASVGTAAAALAALTTKGRAPMTGYSRIEFGAAWSDAASDVPDAHNGCDTRNDILGRDLTNKTWRAGTHNCVVLTGTLHDPYTARTILFLKSRATAVQIDSRLSTSPAAANARIVRPPIT